MKNIVKTLALICVFFALTPGVLIRLPIKGGIYKIAVLHALLFGAIYFIVTNVFGVLREGVTCNGPKGYLNSCASLGSKNTCNSSNVGKCNTNQNGICTAKTPYTLVNNPNKQGCDYTGINNANECSDNKSCTSDKKKKCSSQPNTYDWVCYG